MADFNAAVMTNSGIELLSRTLAGQAKIKFTVLKAGNGIYTAEEKERSVLQTRTELKSEKQTFPFSGIEIITDSSVKLSALMSNNDLTEGYYINEIGIYAVDEMEEEGEEILYSIAIANVADYFPKYNNLSPSTIIQEYYTTVDNSLQVTIQTGLAAVALAEDLLKTIERVKILENPEFDDTGITEGISSFKDFVDSVKNKMNIFQFFRNFKAGLKFIVHTGMIVDNFATKEKGFLPDATLVTALKEQLDEQNKNIGYIDNVLTSKSRFKFLTTSYIDTIKDDYFPEITNGYVNYYVITNSTVIIGYESGDNLRGNQITINYDGNIKRRYKDNGVWTSWVKFILNNDINIQNNTQKILLTTTKENIEISEPANTYYIIRNDYCFVSLSAIKMTSIEGGNIFYNLPKPVGRVNFTLHAAGGDSKPIVWGRIDDTAIYFNNINSSLIGAHGWGSFCYPIAK